METKELESKVAPADELMGWVQNRRDFTLAVLEGLNPHQLLGKRKQTVNPLIWHFGHICWFQERWVLRNLFGREPLRSDADLLYDSFEVPHETRWELPMPSLEDTISYSEAVLENVLEQIASSEPREDGTYFNRLAVFHEGMHNEAMIYDRQAMRYPAPPSLPAAVAPKRCTAAGPAAAGPAAAGPLPGDVEVPALHGFMLGASPDTPYVFDNEKWAHPVDVEAFRIARAPVTNGEFAAFVEAGGYSKAAYWNQWGRLWLKTTKARHPVYWRRAAGGGWQQRRFTRWESLPEHQPVTHVNWHEARAYCAWAGRRLPTEAEWEVAASSERAGGTTARKRMYPWGGELPGPDLANMDCRHAGPVDVAAFPEGDSAHGCRQMIGNVWEWTADPLYPYPGFVVDPYKEYSAPWFGYHKVLRGGSWATPSRMIRNTWRNFFLPERSDIFAGFRTCAL